MKTKIIKYITNIFKKLFLLNYPNKLSCIISEDFELVYSNNFNGKSYKISTPNVLNLYRAKTYFKKEPDMIEWIDNMPDDSVLMDIGANIGLYSIYAAKKGIKKIISIEPESQNYALLNKNIYLNGLSNQISALNIGMSDETKLATLFIPKFEAGAALHNLDINEDWKKNEFEPDFKQSVISFSLDNFLNTYKDNFPTHLKIDVDGIERKIINGSQKTLKNPKLKEIIIELNTELKDDLEIIEILKNNGFNEVSNRSTDEHGDYSALTNYIFTRK